MILNCNSENKIWLITDTHFYHKNIVEYEHRPENYNELIIENWAKLVGPKDYVFHLGDVIFKRAGELTDILTNLNGIKILVRGNHDMRNKLSWFESHGFKMAFDDYFVQKCDGLTIAFSHIPIDLTDTGIDINIHGHFHNPNRLDKESRTAIGYPFYSFDTHLLLSLEEENYKPILLKDFLDKQNF